MRLKTVLAMKLACLVAAICLAFFVAKGNPMPRPPSDVERVRVLRAPRDLPAGTYLNAEKLRYFGGTWYIKGTEPKGAVVNPCDVAGQRLNKDLVMGQLVMRDDLTDPGTWAREERCPRQVSLTVRLEQVQGGFLLPESRVDVRLVVTDPESGDHSDAVLENVPVLELLGDPRYPRATSVTLDLTSEQFKQFRMAQLETIHLIVRPEH